MWELGVVTVPGKPYVYTSSRSHSYQLTIINVVRCTFKDPFDSANMSLKDPSKTYAAAVATERIAAAKESREAEEVYDTRAYIPNKYLYDQECFKIFESVTKTIFNIAVVKDLKEETNESGLALLKLLAKQDAAAKQDTKISSTAATEKDKLVRAGLLSPTVVGFDDFRSSYRAGISQSSNTDFQKLLTAVLGIKDD